MVSKLRARGCQFVLAVLALTLVCHPSAVGVEGKQTLTGTLVDVTCATDPKREVNKLRREHTRKCLLMPVCSESGYALLTENDEVLRFDAKGNDLARKLIEKHPHTENWRVLVGGFVAGNRVGVAQIRLK